MRFETPKEYHERMTEQVKNDLKRDRRPDNYDHVRENENKRERENG